jgi:hypothetical protein
MVEAENFSDHPRTLFVYILIVFIEFLYTYFLIRFKNLNSTHKPVHNLTEVTYNRSKDILNSDLG